MDAAVISAAASVLLGLFYSEMLEGLKETVKAEDKKTSLWRGREIAERLVFDDLEARKIYFAPHVKTLPGKPDIVFRRKRVAVFIESDFWHGHPERFIPPKSNMDYWQAKISRNRARDVAVTAELVAKGWKVLRLWEWDIRHVLKFVLPSKGRSASSPPRRGFSTVILRGLPRGERPTFGGEDASSQIVSERWKTLSILDLSILDERGRPQQSWRCHSHAKAGKRAACAGADATARVVVTRETTGLAPSENSSCVP